MAVGVGVMVLVLKMILFADGGAYGIDFDGGVVVGGAVDGGLNVIREDGSVAKTSHKPPRNLKSISDSCYLNYTTMNSKIRYIHIFPFQ
ncbi:Hypothetical predicted protein [Octopus vulgaris]|uniref:Uncharacterized protein n=1 Tax=Octopus vulgaris TaxID=6645 RepID=A0AA36BRC6_OCTVU|nr:Hypothetical predicted protein [Octopus vulgaris]